MAGNADDQRLVIANEVGRSIRLGVDTTARQTDDALGAIPPGKYLVRAVGLGANSMQVKSVPFVDGASETIAIVAAPAAGATDIVEGIRLEGTDNLFILHVKKDVNDRLVAIMSAGAATLELTRRGT